MDSGQYTEEQSTLLIEDNVIAFGKPAQRLENMPADSVVIVGEQKSYVLSQGGGELVTLLTRLEANNIHLNKALRFESKNDGYFEGNVDLSYVKLADEFTRADMQFFLQNGGKECSNKSDERMQAQRFCFNIPLKGGIYPRVNNFELVRSNYQPLSKPYTMTIYNTKTVQRGNSPIAQVMLLPFALAFDVVTLPLQIMAIDSK